MTSRLSQTSSLTKLIIVIEFLLVAYLMYSLTKNVYNSYQVDKYIENFEKENAALEKENKQKMDDYLYFTSEEYLDKVAKQNLGLINPGEEVIILSPDALADNVQTDADSLVNAKKYQDTNPNRWLKFFFGD